MKRILMYTIIVASLILAACGGATETATQPVATEAEATESPAATEAPATESPATESPATEAPTGGETAERCGDTSQLAEEIFLYNWSDYLDPAIKDQFEDPGKTSEL